MTQDGVRVEETVWIALSDGCRLAARIWQPASSEPVPAILEYLPYRRRDRHRGDDAILHPAMAAAGYACIRVDMRGSGDSDGIMGDEYTAQEWADAVEVIDWLAAQSWCDGNVGMIGLSWSGFNALQVAALAPPALKAVVTACASDDRFRDDMHYMGGCLLSDNLQYGSTLFTWLATPPDPAIVGDRWRSMWQERLEATRPPALEWMRHRTRDDYWRSGSVSEDYSAIRAAVLAVGGWADGYTNAVMRLLEGLPGPRMGLIGPWAHAFPHVATPGPRIDFIGYIVRWWDHWLKGRDTGIMDEPMLTAWLQESEEPRASIAERRGRWIAEESWPSARGGTLRLAATMQGLHEGGGTVVPLMCEVSSAPDLGTASGEWCPYGWGPDMPLDQAGEDGGSVTFDALAQAVPLTILGGAELRLSVVVHDADPMLAVRLNDVSPDGISRRITYGLRRLALDDTLAREEALQPGQKLELVIRLNDVAYELPVGNRLRLAISSAYWPLAVGSPRRSRVELVSAELLVPLRGAAEDAPAAPDLGEAVVAAYAEAKPIVAPERGRTIIERRMASEESVVHVVRNLGAVALDDVGLTLGGLGSETYTMPWRDPSAATSEARRVASFERGEWRVRVETVSRLSFSACGLRFEASLKAHEGSIQIFERVWDEMLPQGTQALQQMECETEQKQENQQVGA
jgi:uncharacterized protein